MLLFLFAFVVQEHIEQFADIPVQFLSGWFDIYARSTVDYFTNLVKRKKGPVCSEINLLSFRVFAKIMNQMYFQQILLIMGPWQHVGNENHIAGEVRSNYYPISFFMFCLKSGFCCRLTLVSMRCCEAHWQLICTLSLVGGLIAGLIHPLQLLSSCRLVRYTGLIFSSGLLFNCSFSFSQLLQRQMAHPLWRDLTRFP